MVISTESGLIYSTIFRLSPTPCLVLDTESLLIRDANEAMELVGYSRDDLLGTRLQELCSGVLAIDEDLGGAPDELSEIHSASLIFTIPEGRHREMQATYRTIRLHSGERVTVIFLFDPSDKNDSPRINSLNGDSDHWV